MRAIVSFPRSGQLMTYSLLWDLHERLGMKFTYCEFYRCCKRLPCAKGCEFSKNHDFQLNVPIQTGIGILSCTVMIS